MTEPVPAPTPSATTKPDSSEFVEKTLALYVDLVQQVRAWSMDQFKHSDSMLTWAIGLMGAGVFYANNLLSSAPRGLRFVALAPWILGILASLAARVIGVRRLEAESLSYFSELMNLRTLPLKSKDLLPTALALLESFLRMVRLARTMGLYWWWLHLWFAAHVLAGTGVLAVVAVSFLPDTAAAMALAVVILGAVVIFVRAVGTIKKAFERRIDEAMTRARKMIEGLGEPRQSGPPSGTTPREGP